MREVQSWNYPALVTSIGDEQSLSRAALRFLVRRLRREVFPDICEHAQRRQRVRLFVEACLEPDALGARRKTSITNSAFAQSRRDATG